MIIDRVEPSCLLPLKFSRGHTLSWPFSLLSLSHKGAPPWGSEVCCRPPHRRSKCFPSWNIFRCWSSDSKSRCPLLQPAWGSSILSNPCQKEFESFSQLESRGCNSLKTQRPSPGIKACRNQRIVFPSCHGISGQPWLRPWQRFTRAIDLAAARWFYSAGGRLFLA